jgi:DDE superfamily endonuclease
MLPPASGALLRQDACGGLPPPLEQQAPHGAHNGKHKSHGLLFLALTDERGNLVWISKARRGAHSEIKATRYDKIEQHLKAADLGAIADLGFGGVNQNNEYPIIITGYKSSKNNKLTDSQKQANRLIAATRTPNEHGFAGLKSWRILERLRVSPAAPRNCCAPCSC